MDHTLLSFFLFFSLNRVKAAGTSQCGDMCTLTEEYRGTYFREKRQKGFRGKTGQELDDPPCVHPREEEQRGRGGEVKGEKKRRERERSMGRTGRV